VPIRCQFVLWRIAKSLICRVSSVVEQRFCNSVLAIPDCFVECQLVNIFGPKTPSQPRLRTSPFCPVPSNWFAKMLAAQAGPRIDVSVESAHRKLPDPAMGRGFLMTMVLY
jgi:hypothetical protein